MNGWDAGYTLHVRGFHETNTNRPGRVMVPLKRAHRSPHRFGTTSLSSHGRSVINLSLKLQA
ncbi:hypothetical protein [Saccharolobus islandicus]|uniref:hypothetical protein n=1 Tax=Saccharolobus islandicus TaxID=43080 RepID=UPI003907EF1C